jgi:hypothetical protein
MAGENNPNWGQCPKCGSPVMIEPKTGVLQPCSNCLSLASRSGGLLGGYWLLVLLVGVAALVYFCVRMLL